MLIRDAAYASLPKPARADLHERFAEWLEARVRHRIEEYREILAYHVEQAYLLRADVAPDDPALEALAARATAALVVAARHADARGDYLSAYSIYSRAVAVPQPATIGAADLLIETMRTGINIADRDEVLALSERAHALARSLGDDTRALHVRLFSLNAQLMADTTFSTADARAIAEQAAARFEAEGDRARLFDALYGISETYHHEGRWNAMDAALTRAGAVARDLGDLRREQDADMARLGCVYWSDAPASEGLALCDELLERWPQSLNVRAAVECLRARSLGLLGRFDEADRKIAEWLALVDRLGDRMSLHTRGFTTAPMARMRGDNETAAAEAEWSSERLEEAGHRGLVATLEGFRGVVLAELGRGWDEAAEAAARSRELSHPDDLDSESFWRVAEAWVTAHRGELDGAVRLLRDAIEIIDRSDEILFQADARMALAGVLELRGDTGEARAAVGEALAQYRRKECVPGIADARGTAESALGDMKHCCLNQSFAVRGSLNG